MIVYNETNHILSIRNCNSKKLKQLTLSTATPSSPQTVRYVHLLRTRYFLLLVAILIKVRYMRLPFASNGSSCPFAAHLALSAYSLLSSQAACHARSCFFSLLVPITASNIVYFIASSPYMPLVAPKRSVAQERGRHVHQVRAAHVCIG